MLTKLTLPTVLDTSTGDLTKDFFIPVLNEAIEYVRGVGFFSSEWMRINAKGMKAFATNGGRARWVTSPILSKEDWQALQTGEEARFDPVLRAAMQRNIDDLERMLEEETLSALAWMIADGVLEFKLALPRGKLDGEFHDKFGVFTDAAGNQVRFKGSYNDSLQGTRNYESIDIFCSWIKEFKPLVIAEVERFERLWSNLDPNLRVFDLDEAARERIVRCRKVERPYPKPDWVRENRDNYRVIGPQVPRVITLRDYQNEAIQAWFENDCHGLLEMATGTGKTITALAASVRLFVREKRLAIIIACPYQHLVDQWYQEASDFGYSLIRAYRSRESWLDELNNRVIFYNHKDSHHLGVITTHATYATDHFQDTVARIDGPALLIADEVHHLGAERSRQHLPDEISYRLALSATPDRWYDDAGTVALRSYFGSTVFELSLANAIGISLTPYYYYPILVELTEEEIEEYRALSARIGGLIAKGEQFDENEQLSMLLIKRGNLLNTASNKLEVISDLVDQQPEITHTLFYCAPGQIDNVVRLLGWEKRLQVHRFTAREDIPTRRALLRDFADQKLQALVAMRCLDEGVDVPSTRTAYILASSGNPRQFIQRRGRVLRMSPGKEFATIYDLITVPPDPDDLGEASLSAERSILRRELRRFTEFADSARNPQAAYDVIWDLAEKYGVLDF